MQNLVAYAVLIVGMLSIFPVSVSAQQAYTERGINAHIGFDASKTFLQLSNNDNVAYGYSNNGLSVGLDYNFNLGFNPLLQVSHYRMKENVAGFNSNSRIWYFMGGLNLKIPDYPVYLNILAGLNRHTYLLSEAEIREQGFDIIDESFLSEQVDKFSMEFELGLKQILFNRLPIGVGVGTRGPLNSDAVFDNIFLKINASCNLGRFFRSK